MRFDDSLATVLAADTDSPHGAAAAWRQLVDLAARHRVDATAAVERLRLLRAKVPASVRVASGRAMSAATVPAMLVALFAEDEPAIAAPVLRSVRLAADDWLTLLPTLSPTARAILRHRRDLPDAVVRGLASFGAADFVLEHDAPICVQPVHTPTPVATEPLVMSSSPDAADEPRFEIADLVARIDAFRRQRPGPVADEQLLSGDSFQFHTDAAGVIRWIEGVARGALIGVSLASSDEQGAVRIDGEAGVAIRARRPFRDAILTVAGTSSASGRWRLAGQPRFDRASGEFTGVAGVARRIGDQASVVTASDALRELVHELRTPANAITGFAELIATELLGPVPAVYRDRAQLVRRQGDALADAIADLDTAARLDGGALELRPAPLDLSAMVRREVADLQAVAQARHVRLAVSAGGAANAFVDDRMARRLFGRLLAAAITAALPGEQLIVQVAAKTRSIRVHVTRPRTLTASDDRLLAIDEEDGGDELLLLGIGFTLRLVRSLAEALGGSLSVGAERLTLRLPAAVTATMEQAAAQ